MPFSSIPAGAGEHADAAIPRLRNGGTAADPRHRRAAHRGDRDVRACYSRRRAASTSSRTAAVKPMATRVSSAPAAAPARPTTSAPAMTSSSSVHMAWRIQVYPRGCGERVLDAERRRREPGSSPRVRGTVYLDPLPRGQARFIPAGAGNGISAGRWWWSPAVHPRGCGERERIELGPLTPPGSSPRVRGTGRASSGSAGSARFIPAGAGNG